MTSHFEYRKHWVFLPFESAISLIQVTVASKSYENACSASVNGLIATLGDFCACGGY